MYNSDDKIVNEIVKKIINEINEKIQDIVRFLQKKQSNLFNRLVAETPTDLVLGLMDKLNKSFDNIITTIASGKRHLIYGVTKSVEMFFSGDVSFNSTEWLYSNIRNACQTFFKKLPIAQEEANLKMWIQTNLRGKNKVNATAMIIEDFFNICQDMSAFEIELRNEVVAKRPFIITCIEDKIDRTIQEIVMSLQHDFDVLVGRFPHSGMRDKLNEIFSEMIRCIYKEKTLLIRNVKSEFDSVSEVLFSRIELYCAEFFEKLSRHINGGEQDLTECVSYIPRGSLTVCEYFKQIREKMSSYKIVLTNGIQICVGNQ
jgi:hypothetical protein